MQTLHGTSTLWPLTAVLTLIGLPACSDSGAGDEIGETGGDTTGEGDTSGDGDGDTSGDGDGDTSGDGDGDTSGDGDGDTGGDGDGDTMGDELSFELDVYPIIDANCSCHDFGAGDLSMQGATTAYNNLVDVAAVLAPNLDRVTPSDTANSFLYQKVTATHDGLSPANAQMPKTPNQALSDNPLLDGDIATIEAWINGGALP